MEKLNIYNLKIVANYRREKRKFFKTTIINLEETIHYHSSIIIDTCVENAYEKFKAKWNVDRIKKHFIQDHKGFDFEFHIFDFEDRGITLEDIFKEVNYNDFLKYIKQELL